MRLHQSMFRSQGNQGKPREANKAKENEEAWEANEDIRLAIMESELRETISLYCGFWG